MAYIDISPYTTANPKRHIFYKDSVEKYESIKTHADGTYPKKLIEERRPGESLAIYNYRKTIFQPVTKIPISKVFSSLMKIRKSDDWNIKWSEVTVPSIPDGESLKDYCDKKFPKYKSVDNWYWSVAFRQQLMDAGAISLNIPDTFDPKGNEFVRPYPVVFNSPQIYDYKEGEYYFLLSTEKSSFVSEGTRFEGSVYYYVDTVNIVRYTQTGHTTYSEEIYSHNIARLPVVKMNGYSIKDTTSNTLYESRISPMVPRLDEAIREYNDMQAEVIMHIHSTFWGLGRECKKCKGTGEVAKKGSSPIECSTCKGRGEIPASPFDVINVKTGMDGKIVTPPAGYLQKDISIAELQDKRVNDHIFLALAAINFEFLAASPLNQSGAAKEVDKSELNNFAYSIAEDAVRVIDETIEINSDMRYSYVIKDKEKRDEMLPKIMVPTKYDIIPDNYLSSEIQKLRTAKVSPVIVASAEVEYAEKKFYSDPMVKEMVLASYKLDPLSGRDNNDIVSDFGNDGISERTYVLHCNIHEFIERAVSENKDFLSQDMNVIDQRNVLYGYADEFIKAKAPSTSIKADLNNGNSGGAAN